MEKCEFADQKFELSSNLTLNNELWAYVTFYKLNHIWPTWYQIKAYMFSFHDSMDFVRL